MKISCEAHELPPGSGSGDLFKHCRQLRWHCAEAGEYFKDGEKRKKND